MIILEIDFIIANGLEEKLFSHTNLPIFIYPVYPSVRNKKKLIKKTIISYHIIKSIY